MSAKIFVISHKPFDLVKTDIFQPIAVGENKDKFSATFLKDDVGENISSKNHKYNELTAIYWVYKHLNQFKDADYIGFCHYRRRFCFQGLDKTAYVKKSNDERLSNVFDDKLSNLFKDYDFICPKPSHYKSVKKHFIKTHNKEDLDILLKCINDISPEYKDAAEAYLNGKDEFLYNMFIFNRGDFVKYCEFIFPVLEQFESYKKDNERLYVSERLTGIFITHLLRSGSLGLSLPILHVREKSFKGAHRQVKDNFKNAKDRSLIYKLKPLFLYYLPRNVEQHLRRRKTR